MVEKFGYSAADIALLYLLNHSINTLVAPRIGRFVARFGERLTLILEYSGLILIFTAYAFVEVAWIAAILFVLDHVLFAMAIAIRSYFKKIADPQDMASTASVAFTINHIAAVIIPASFGLLWLIAPAAVFLAGAGLACCSLILALLVPRHPEAGNEARLLRPPAKVPV
jgi:predicted MFS family arabinose efflux permease